jgi:MYXO-CTERM domain-containing protein
MHLSRLLTLSALATPLALAALTLAAPQRASACGGTFCDAGPQQMPVDQTGENILFVLDGAKVEAHIQIQYDPDTNAETFAWVIPVLEVPAFSVGSDPLFTNVLNGTVPSYSLSTQTESCGDESEQANFGGSDTASETGAGDSAGDGGPNIVHRQTVGAFDIVVLEGEDVPGLMQWLTDNGFQQDPAAEPIFQEYLDEDYLFAAFKLTTGAGVDQIHPVVLEFNTGEACIPLRLTKIAAQEDMEVRTFFLGDSRTVPRNYRHVLVNPLKIDWLDLPNIAENYKDVITQAVDALKADGHAFVTEYAGSSNIVSRFGVHNESWESFAFIDAAPIDVIDLLEGQGNLVSCYEGFEDYYYGEVVPICDYAHPLIEGLLNEFLPVPESVAAADFYGCLSCFESLIDLNAWSGPMFAQALQERVIDPGAHAIELLDAWPYLTRMYTTISPGEMTEAPFFHQNPDLDDVDNVRQGSQEQLCTGHSTVTLPDGRVVKIPMGQGWPDFEGEMPWEEEVQTISISGAPMTLVDNTEIIDQKLAAWNQQVEDEYDFNAYDTSEGCGCRVERRPAGALAAGLALLMLLGARRRRQHT